MKRFSFPALAAAVVCLSLPAAAQAPAPFRLQTALDLEKLGKARILMRFGQIVQDFHIHVIFATDKLIASRPDAVRGFLEGWFETIAFMRGHKAETVDIAKEVMNKDAEITSRTYDELMPMFSDDGRFIAMWAGDAGYENDDPTTPGARNRLLMLDEGWSLDRSS